MDEAPSGQRVICRHCRFIFAVELPPRKIGERAQDWRVEEQCPACDSLTSFTIVDTPERQPAPPKEDEAERHQKLQELGKRHFEPITRNRSDPTVRWFDRVGNGVFEDDCSEISWPAPWMIYCFRRGKRGAHIWEEEGRWYVRPWAALQGERGGQPVLEVASFEAALDELTD
jgi:hypothetical protein